jgi:hypothetical protein
MALTQLHVLNYCNAGGSWWNGNGQMCKFLTYEMVGQKYTPLCMKKAPAIVTQKKKEGKLPSNFDKLGDNCQGYTYLKHKEQGYDL